MTYEESAQLMTDPAFRGRVKVACLKFADAIFNEPGSVAGHNTRVRWAQTCYLNPDQTSMQVTPPTVMDSNVQASGKDVADGTLQGAVEATVAKSL